MKKDETPGFTDESKQGKDAMERRTFLKGSGLVAGGLVASSVLPNAVAGQVEPKGKDAPVVWKGDSGRPNILVIIVDQLRFPQGLFNQEVMDLAAPNIKQLRSQSVSFDYHYIAAAMCSPSRSTMLTGLYTHQTGMFLTNTQGLFAGAPSTPDLDPGFPTWGSILRKPEFGYNTYWWGKWHLSGNDATTPDFAEQYGFNMGGLPCPSPNGAPGQGLGVDPQTTQVFQDWLKIATECGPWCTTVSLVNPHDIAWYPKYTVPEPPGSPEPTPGEGNPPPIFSELPPNFERWPEALVTEGKPGLQQAFVLIGDLVTGVMPANPITPAERERWHRLLDLYVQVTNFVDRQVGAVLDALEAVELEDGSSLADNTIVVFTSDHGEYGGSHGLRNKGFAAYEECIHVPFYVYDPTGTVIPPDQRGTTRNLPNQLTSHVDLVPLLMTLTSGDNGWRGRPQYGHLAGRADMFSMLSDENAQGRDYIITTSDEDLPEESVFAGLLPDKVLEIIEQLGYPPSHVIGYRTNTAKLGVYSRFAEGTIDIVQDGQQAELYKYPPPIPGRDEVVNHAPGNVLGNSGPGGSAPDPVLYETMYNALFNPRSGAVANELRQPLPNSLKQVQRRALDTYLAYEACLADPTQCPDPPKVNC